MMKVSLLTNTPDIERTIVHIARVSSSRKDKSAEPEKLINYLIKNAHYSPFEHGFLTVDITTSIPVSIHLLRHRSFTFQQLSARYQDVSTQEDLFQEVELRRQAADNRQSSTETFDPLLWGILHANVGTKSSTAVAALQNQSKVLYKSLLAAGVARETARMVLPLCTSTRLYMTGNVRSWLGFLNLRLDHHSQKETVDIAIEIAKIIKEVCPAISAATNNFNNFQGKFM